jgi:hypothetical protein
MARRGIALVPGTGLEPASRLRRRIFVTLRLSTPLAQMASAVGQPPGNLYAAFVRWTMPSPLPQASHKREPLL